MPANGDHYIIGEPMMVDCLKFTFGCLSSYAVEIPVKICQINVRSQGTKRATLSYAYLSGSFDYLLHESHDLRVFDSPSDLVQKY